MPGIDYRQLRSQVCMREVLALIGFVAEKSTGAQVRGRCPLHPSDSVKSRVFSAQLRKNMFRCFKCHACGNHLDLWAAVTRQPFHEAALDLCRRLGRPVPWIATEKRNP